VSFYVLLTDGRERRYHQDQLQFRTVEIQRPDTPVEMEDLPISTTHESENYAPTTPMRSPTAAFPAAEPLSTSLLAEESQLPAANPHNVPVSDSTPRKTHLKEIEHLLNATSPLGNLDIV